MTTITAIHEAPIFPISFDDAADAAHTYMFDPMHFPAPLSPLFQSVLAPAFEHGFTAAARSLDLPIDRAKVTFQNNYYFLAVVPMIPANEEEARALGQRADARMRAELPRLMQRWEGEYLPRIKANNDRLGELDVDRASGEQLPALLDEVLEIAKDNWRLHFHVGMPVAVAMQLYDELYVDLFGGTEQDAHALLVGVPSASINAGIGLSDLAGAAKAMGLAQFLLETPAERALEALATVPAGAAFVAAIRKYLRDYGLRQDLVDYVTPTWREDPSIAVAGIQAYLRSGHDARAEHEAARQRAEVALATARGTLAVYPDAIRREFDDLVAAARAAYFLAEEHNFYIDQQTQALTRLLFHRLGARLARDGVLVSADDVFMLSLEELKDLAAGSTAGAQDRALLARVLERRADLARSSLLTPPPFVGRPPAGPPPSESPVERAHARFFGGPPQEAAAPNQLKGNPGSRGQASGRARVARTLADAKTLQPGEILVAVTTMPAWTPFFGVAAAVVTETGGPLCHGAIVAREYGIPAVVGAAGATRAIRSGQRITVDGTTGVVTIAGTDRFAVDLRSTAAGAARIQAAI